MPISAKVFPTRAATPYPLLRSELRDGDVLIASGSGIFSAMIQQATDSVWSHVGFILRIPTIDRVMLLESVEPVGVRTIRLSRYLEDYAGGKPYPGGLAIIRHRRFPSVPADALRTLSEFAIDQFGYPYDKEDIARIAARIMAAKVKFARKQMARFEQNREYICSEYVARCYEQADLQVRWNALGFIAPADFARDPHFDLVAVMQGLPPPLAPDPAPPM